MIQPEDAGGLANGKLNRTAFKGGAKAMLPILVGVAPFAAVAGLAGTHNGLSITQTAAFSLLAYAGAAQIAALQLMGNHASAGVVILTALIINLRFVIYSAALAPQFTGASLARRSWSAYLLVDHAVAISLPRFGSMPSRTNRISFYLGACATFWATWQTGSLLGSVLGSMPSSGLLEFAMPLSFLALLSPHLKDAPKSTTAVLAALSALLLMNLPANAGMVLGTGIGLAAGAAVGWRDLGRAAAR